MKVAISTLSLASGTNQALTRAADLGFKVVEVNLLAHEYGNGYRRQPDEIFYRQLQADIEQTGLQVWSVTAPPLTQEHMFSQRARKEILRGSAIIAGLLGAKVLVMQPADIFRDQQAFDGYMPENKAPAVIDGFDEAWVQAVNRKITMALMNRDYWIGSLLTNQAERLASIVQDLALGCALDIRQALNRSDLGSWLASVGERLAVGYAYDMNADGQRRAPTSHEWSDWLPALADGRLKTMVIQAAINQSDEEFIQSRQFLESLVKG
jgi:hypothetical protein